MSRTVAFMNERASSLDPGTSWLIRDASRTSPDSRTQEMTRVKTRLLSYGLRLEISASARGMMKPMLRVRSGSCGGLDLVLPDGTWVNAPVNEPFAARSPLRLVGDESGVALVDEGQRLPVELVPAPAYYAFSTTTGARMQRIGQLCSDRIGIGMTNVCRYWRSRQDRCRFCSIGHNVRDEDTRKTDGDVLETILAAVRDPIAPARHVLLGGGTPDGGDAGATRIAHLTRLIKAEVDVPIYAMLAPPRANSDLDALADAGLDEIALNLEVFSEQAAREYIPGKHAAIGFARYWDALQHAVKLFGPINTRSLTVVGLETPATTLAGVRRLSEMGVMPILSPLRPLAGTPLASRTPPDEASLWDLTLAARDAALVNGVPLGPLCICCQSNTLTMPGDGRYHHY